MYTAIYWVQDLALYATITALVCFIWWAAHALISRFPPAQPRTSSRSSDARGSGHAPPRIVAALPLIYRRSRASGALLPREDSPDTPTTAEIPVIGTPASSIWTLPHALPLAWVLYLVGLGIFTLLPLPRNPQAVCTAIIHWDNYVPLGSLWAVVEEFQAGEIVRGTLYGASIILNVFLFIPLGALAETTWRWMRHRYFSYPRWGRLVRPTPLGRLLAWVALGCALSCLIEYTQYTGLFGLVPCTYRVVDVDDVLTNTLGTFLGVRLAWTLGRGRG